MQYGAHLPLIHIDGRGWRPGELGSFTDAARDLGFGFIGANDHLIYHRPWLDSIVALASVLDRSKDMRLATTVALPVLRGPIVLAKAAAALDILSGGRLILGVGPGSSERDYRAAGVPFDERWSRLDESLRVLRTHLTPGTAPVPGRYYFNEPTMEPAPVQPTGPPIWIGSWGSDAGLRRVARHGDGWIASAWNLTPAKARAARATLAAALAQRGRTLDGFPCALGTMWTYVTEDSRTQEAQLAALASMHDRPVPTLQDQVLVGPAEHCAAVLRAYADAGMDTVFVWPLADAEKQLELLMHEVAPLV